MAHCACSSCGEESDWGGLPPCKDVGYEGGAGRASLCRPVGASIPRGM